ncbi:MAG: hypothetical protein AB9835_01375 [Eubacteriales bacterium]
MNNLNNYAEYLTVRKDDAKLIIRKLLLVIGTMGSTAVISVVFLRPLIYVIPLVWLGGSILLWSLWKFVKIEYEYTVAGGEVSFDIIYGQRNRRKLISAKVKELSLIAPATGTYRHRIEAQDISKRHYFCSSLDAPNLYFIEYNDPKEGKTLIFFDATKKTMAAFKFYNSANTYIGDLPF